MKALLLVAVLAALSLPVVATAGITFTPDKGTAQNAARPLSPGPLVACGGTCIGGGTPGCGTVVDQPGDGYGNTLQAVYHWCWNLQSVYNAYGHSYVNPCWGFCSLAVMNYDYDFQWGHRDQATFNDIGIGNFSVRNTDSAGVCVNKMGNFWQCR